MRARKRSRYEVLEWDSRFFGFKVARISPPRLGKLALRSLFEEIRAKGVSLVYWASDPSHESSQRAARSLGGFLADIKITYSTRLKKSPPLKSQLVVREYKRRTPSRELYDLAVQSGQYSRFKADPNVGVKNFKRLYGHWIENSVNKKLADAVLTVSIGRKIRGMVVVKAEGRVGRICLIAVDRRFSGHGIGTALVAGAHRWFISKGCFTAQVVTQKSNIQACNFYLRRNYSVARTEAVYHFWL
jgi:dTDP-4-amino-4,6-dideoxy-D-galactose acyltransferase